MQLDVDERRTGLPCRAVDCETFFPILPMSASVAFNECVGLRNSHELSVHGYVHVPLQTRAWPKFGKSSWGYQPGWNKRNL